MRDPACSRIRHRIAALRTHHARLEAQLAHEARQKLPDPFRLNALKRRKLYLKDEITRLQTG